MQKYIELKKKNYLTVILTGIIISVLVLSITAFADTFGGKRTLNSDGYVEICPAGSIAAAEGYTDMFNNAVNKWSNISSNMKGILSIDDILKENIDIAYLDDTSTSGLLGTCVLYKKFLGFTVSASPDDNWLYARTFFYENQMDAYNMTNAQKTANMVHELGHLQKLAHPTTTQTSIMNQGIQSIGVTTYDKSEIKSKWGN